jgi:hypothetical protein
MDGSKDRADVSQELDVSQDNTFDRVSCSTAAAAPPTGFQLCCYPIQPVTVAIF